MMNQAKTFFKVELSRDRTRLEENYWDAETAVNESIDSIHFPVYLSRAYTVHFY